MAVVIAPAQLLLLRLSANKFFVISIDWRCRCFSTIKDDGNVLKTLLHQKPPVLKLLNIYRIFWYFMTSL